MNTEEKAKAYDEAIERAKKVLLDCTPEEQKVVEYITPELKESEDERIRIELLNYLWDVHDDDEERARWLAWLEKRDEQKDWANELNDKIQELHKQCITQIKEQKPELKFDIPEIKIKDDVSVTSRVEHISEELKPIADFVIDYSHWNLHKDEWNHPVPEVPLFRVLDALVQEGKPYQGCDSCIEQKPVEWSEEDEKEIEEIIDILTQRPFIGTFFLQKHITWLKSLRPQSQWKPSELDILLLERIANGKSNPQDFQASLYGLIGQLKKLRKK